MSKLVFNTRNTHFHPEGCDQTITVSEQTIRDGKLISEPVAHVRTSELQAKGISETDLRGAFLNGYNGTTGKPQRDTGFAGIILRSLGL